ncbi:Ribonuclease/ribotoxin [Podospora australis]|uniref:ribonuclease T1 n=1 Tax=Podospora australis TaxID=1536484 RepID=A0AAN7AEC2_9PEZI|nr:Ribonuclease/ribotoxin [Podospora australis]
MPSLKSLALLTLATAASAFTEESIKLIQDRAVKGYQCGTTKYTLADVENAMGDGIALRKRLASIKGINNVDWPHEFRNGRSPTTPEVDPAPCKGLNLYEFPILASKRDFAAGGQPGPDRVVFADSNKTPGAFEQCFLMTHSGASGNLFVKCKTT